MTRLRVVLFSAVALIASGFTPASVKEAGAQSSATQVAPQPIVTEKGVTITPPAGWQVASKDTISQVNAVVKSKLNLDGIDWDRMAVMLFDPSSSYQVTPNLNVIVTDDEIPINDEDSESKLASVLREGYSNKGFQISRLDVSKKQFGPHHTLTAECEYSAMGMSNRLWQVCMPISGSTLIVSCTASQDTFNRVVPAFSRALASIQYSGGSGGGGGLGGNLPPWLKDALIGAIIGGLMGFFKMFSGSGKSGGASNAAT